MTFVFFSLILCTQSTELLFSDTVFQHSAYRGSSHQRKGAASRIFDMVWLYRSPPVGEEGRYFTCL
jgi:hypothetical protein